MSDTGLSFDAILEGFAKVGIPGPDAVTWAQHVSSELSRFGLNPEDNRLIAKQAAGEVDDLKARITALESALIDARRDQAETKALAEDAAARAYAHEHSTRLLEQMADPIRGQTPVDTGTIVEIVRRARANDPAPEAPTPLELPELPLAPDTR